MTGCGSATRGVLVACGTTLCMQTAMAETKIETTQDTIDEQFAIASQHFGDGQVQVHTRRDTADGSTHHVYSFNCQDQTHSLDYEGAAAPESFPVEASRDPLQPLNRDSAAAPVGQYACEEHGHPLLEWRW